MKVSFTAKKVLYFKESITFQGKYCRLRNESCTLAYKLCINREKSRLVENRL